MERPCSRGIMTGAITCCVEPSKELCGRCGWNPESTVREERITRELERRAEERRQTKKGVYPYAWRQGGRESREGCPI